MGQTILGLDIRRDAVAAVRVTRGMKGLHIADHAHVPLEYQGDFEAGLAATLEMLREQMPLEADACVAALPSHYIFYHNLDIPFQGRKKIAQVLPFELEPQIPFAIEDLAFDFLAANGGSPQKTSAVLAAMIEKERLRRCLDTLASFAIDPETVCAGGFPAAFCLAQLGEIPDKSILLDLGRRHCSFFLTITGRICLAREIPLRSMASDNPLSDLCQEVERSICGFAESTGENFTPEALFLTGYEPDAGLEKQMSLLLDMPVRQTDLGQAFRDEITGLELPPWEPGQMNNGLALALMHTKGLKGFNFRRGQLARKRFWQEHKRGIVASALLAATVLALFCFNIALDNFLLQKRADALDRDIRLIFKTSFPEVQNIVDPLRQMEAELKAYRTASSRIPLPENRILKVEILNEISKRIGNDLDVELTRLVMGSERVSLAGHTDRFNTVDAVKSRLARIAFLKNVKIDSAKIDPALQRVRFSINAGL